jgi:hypothetical protein
VPVCVVILVRAALCPATIKVRSRIASPDNVPQGATVASLKMSPLPHLLHPEHQLMILVGQAQRPPWRHNRRQLCENGTQHCHGARAKSRISEDSIRHAKSASLLASTRNALLLALSLGACSTTEVLPVGPDTYRVNAAAPHGLGGYATAGADALKKANEYCQSQGRQIMMVTDQNASSLGIGAAAVTFRCLAPGEPGLQRPNYRPAPNVVIENRVTRD